MNAYQKTLAEDQRYLMLAALAQDADYRINSGILHTIVGQYGHAVSSDQVRTQMSWLAEQGLITIDKLNDHTHVAQLTDRGLDVAQGRAQVPGVRRPRPERAELGHAAQIEYCAAKASTARSAGGLDPRGRADARRNRC